MSDLHLNLTFREVRQICLGVLCTHCAVYTLYYRAGLVSVHLSAVYVNPVLCTQDGVYAVHMYRVPVQCGSVKAALNRFIVQAYTPEAGRLQCFHPSFVSVSMALYVRPSQRETTGQEEDEENGWEETAYVLLCCFRSTRHVTYSGQR